MGDGLMQRFSTIGTLPGSSTTSIPPMMDTGGLKPRIHHEPSPPVLIGGKYPVYGPGTGTGPEVYEEETSEYWPGTEGTGPGGFFPSFLPWGQPQGTHPVPAPVPPLPLPPPPPYPVYRGPYGGKIGKGLRFRGASVAVLTLLAFLFFLSILQNYIRDYSTTAQPTVILLSAGATKENLPLYPYRIRQKLGHRSDEESVRFDEDDTDAGVGEAEYGHEAEGHAPLSEAGANRAVPIKKGLPHHKRHQKTTGTGKVTLGGNSNNAPLSAPFGDIFKVNGL